MKKRIFVPVESHPYASPEMRLAGQRTDIGLLAEALVLFEQVDLNLTNAGNLADILQSFLATFGSISPLLDLITGGYIRVHYFDFMAVPVEKDGKYTYWNIQDSDAQKSHKDSFRQKILQHEAIDAILPKARHRQRLYDVVAETAIIDGSENYGSAIEAARESSKFSADIEYALNALKDSLPAEQRKLFPDRIEVRAEHDPKAQVTKHTYNFNLEALRPFLKPLNFGMHIPGLGLVQTHRILAATQRHNYDTYLPKPLSDIVIAKMDSFANGTRKFAKTRVDLTLQAAFPDIRGSFNTKAMSWKDILAIRKKASRFQEWFSAYGGNPEIALASYGEEYRASTGLKGYKEKLFSIATYIAVATGAGIGAAISGPTGAMLGSVAGGASTLVQDLFKAADEDGWTPRFFGNWVHHVQHKKNG